MMAAVARNAICGGARAVAGSSSSSSSGRTRLANGWPGSRPSASSPLHCPAFAQPRLAVSRRPHLAALEKAGNETDKGPIDRPRSIMLREEVGAPITVLKPAMYYSVMTEDFEFLIASDDEGQLDLQTCFIVDLLNGISSRATVDSRVPAGLRAYMQVRWKEEDTGDVIFGKKGSTKVLRWYYVEILDGEAEPNIDAVFVFEPSTRSVSTVDVVKGEGWDDEDAYIRILEDGSVVLQSSESTPTPELVVREAWNEFIGQGGLTAGAKVDMDDYDEDIEFDLDVPEVDM